MRSFEWATPFISMIPRRDSIWQGELKKSMDMDGLEGRKTFTPTLLHLSSLTMRGDQELRDEDDLRYWRSYGNEGKGCSIRFPVRDIPFRRVLYGQEKVTRALDTLDLTSIWNVLEPLTTDRNERVGSAARDILSERIRRNITRILYLYKDDAYKYEQECRMVKAALEVAEGDIRFEPLDEVASPHTIRHYYQDSALRIDNILVTRSLITIGPLVPRPHNVMYYINTLLERAGLSGPKLKVSRIPYQEPLQ